MSPPTVLLALAAGMMAAVKLRAAWTAKKRFFIGTLQFQSGEVSGFDEMQMGLITSDDRWAFGHKIYASTWEVAELGPGAVLPAGEIGQEVHAASVWRLAGAKAGGFALWAPG